MRFFLAVALAGCLAIPQARADDAAEANKMMVEATRLVNSVDAEPSAEGKIALWRRAHALLTAIVERFPSTDLAVRLATGQRVGRISLAGVRSALDNALLARPGKPGRPVHVWRYGSGITIAMFFRQGRRALTVTRNGNATVRDAGTGQVLNAWRHEGGIAVAAVSRDRRRILTMGKDRSAALRNVRTGTLLERWWNRGVPSAAALSPRGRRALVGLRSAVYLIGIKDRKVLRRRRHGAPVTVLAWSPDGRRAFVGFADGRARLVDARTGKRLHSWKHRGSAGGGVMSVAFSGDGRRVVSGSASGIAALRDVETGKTLRKWDIGYSIRVRSLAHSPNRPWVLIGDDGKEIELRNAGTAKLLRKWTSKARPVALAFSPDSRRVLMGFDNGVVIVCPLVLPARGARVRTVLTARGGC